MRKILLFLGLSVLSILVLSCSRQIPAPGEITIAPSFLNKHAGAAGDLLGTTLYLTVKQASGDYQQLAKQQLMAKFILGNEYQLYRRNRINILVSDGSYIYELDPYHVNQAHLIMFGKNGLTFTLLFTSGGQGSFYARPNNASIQAILMGSFILKLNNQDAG